MSGTVIADRSHFAVLILFHYLFPQLTIGLGLLIVALKSLHLVKKDEKYARAAHFWAKIFAVNFGAGVATGIPMEFQFGTNWATFSRVAGGVIGQGLMMEGMYAFFLESAFLGLFLFGEKRVSPRVHWFAALMVAVGSVISSYFIMTADAFMQHPVAYHKLPDGRLEITSLWGYLTNPYLGWGFLHTVNGALVTACMVMTALGAYYLLIKRHAEFARVCLTLGLIAGFIFSLTQVFPTGAKNGETVTKYNPLKLAAMEGQFKTEHGAPLAIIGMPDTATGTLMDPIQVPKLLSYLAYGDFRAEVKGLNEWDKSLWPPVEVTYYAYHVMITLGGYFIGLMGLGVLLLWRKQLFDVDRWYTQLYLWLLLLSLPFPYIANEAGWAVTCVGRQPWLVVGVLRTADGISKNVFTGQVIFTLIGFVGIYIVLGLLFLYTTGRMIVDGPEEAPAVPTRMSDPEPELVPAGGAR